MCTRELTARKAILTIIGTSTGEIGVDGSSYRVNIDTGDHLSVESELTRQIVDRLQIQMKSGVASVPPGAADALQSLQAVCDGNWWKRLTARSLLFKVVGNCLREESIIATLTMNFYSREGYSITTASD